MVIQKLIESSVCARSLGSASDTVMSTSNVCSIGKFLDFCIAEIYYFLSTHRNFKEIVKAYEKANYGKNKYYRNTLLQE